MIRNLIAVALLFTAGFAHAQDDRCWNGSRPKASVKDVTPGNGRFHITIAVRPTGAAFLPNRDAAGFRVGYDPATQTEWVQAVTFPLEAGLANREVYAADVTLTSRALVGAPSVDVVPWWYSGWGDGPAGAVSGLPLASFLFALTNPGSVYGTGLIESRSATTFPADDLAWDAYNAVDGYVDGNGRPIRNLTFFLTSSDPAPTRAAYADISKVRLTLYSCPAEPDPFASGRRSVVEVDDEFADLENAPEVGPAELYRMLKASFNNQKR